MTDSSARRIGLGALVARTEALGWSEEARARLEVYRADVAPFVAEAAQLTFPPDPPAAPDVGVLAEA